MVGPRHRWTGVRAQTRGVMAPETTFDSLVLEHRRLARVAFDRLTREQAGCFAGVATTCGGEQHHRGEDDDHGDDDDEWVHRDDLFTFLRQPELDATNWRAELAIRFGVILRKVWGGSRTWVGARA